MSIPTINPFIGGNRGDGAGTTPLAVLVTLILACYQGIILVHYGPITTTSYTVPFMDKSLPLKPITKSEDRCNLCLVMRHPSPQ